MRKLIRIEEDNFNNGEKIKEQYAEFCKKYGNGKDGRDGRDKDLVRIWCNLNETREDPEL